MVALTLLGVFAGTIVLHYAAVAIVLCCECDPASEKAALDYMADIFGKLLPAEVGLLGAATAFYFTSERGG